MLKIGKLKQWTGEKMGKAPKTRMDEDFHILQTETDARKSTLERLSTTSQAYLKAISKRIEGDDKHKSLAIESFGQSMSSQGHALREGSVYREALIQMGDAHRNMGAAQNELALQKKLQSRRLDYDAKLAKVQKAKKEKPEWEEEMQAAKAKYEETRESVVAIMTDMNDSQDEGVRSLKAYYDAQVTFHRKMLEILEGIPESTFTTASSSPRAPRPRKTYRQSSDESMKSDDHSSTQSLSNSGRRQIDRASTISDFSIQTAAHVARNTSHVRAGSFVAPKANGQAQPPPPPPPVPSRKKQQKQVRALYNFEATGEGELSLQKGDVVRIIEEIDEGWWEGEMVDSKGVRHEGMFPSNYVEEVSSDTASERRQESISSSNSDPKYADEDEAAYYARDDDPGVKVQPETPVYTPTAKHPSQPSTRQPPSGQANGAVSPSSARATPPLGRPVSGIMSKPIGSRAPPPPPASRRVGVDTMRQSAIFNQASSPTEGMSSPSGPLTPGSGYISRDYFASQAVDSTPVGPCRECQCEDFSANVFKRGSCNNCFHVHE
ncbi:hypothetical protein BGX34_010361 [Mortierella sp. NVP85]|nr:hypothetical protein BGX34_010361 [Mortierella sp. NVP85]